LPDLVTFTDINDPKSVIEVDPNNIQATLGSNLAWNEITLESTDEAVTEGIEARLPWLGEYYSSMLDGNRYQYLDARKTIANSLSPADFWWPAKKR